jgi:hypothetical protein
MDFINHPDFPLFLAGICLALEVPLVEIDRRNPNSVQLIFETTHYQAIFRALSEGKLKLEREEIITGMKQAFRLINTT